MVYSEPSISLMSQTTEKTVLREKGSMPLALMLVVGIIIVAMGVVSVFGYQVAGDRLEEADRRAQWAMDSMMNVAVDQIGVSGRSLSNFPRTEPEEYTVLPDNAVGKWWVTTKDIATPVNIALPGIPAAVASDGSTWIVVSDSNQIYRSNDGDVWSPTGRVPGAQVARVVSIGNTLVALPKAANTEGVRNPPYHSSDGGITWATANLPGAWLGTETSYDAACSQATCIIVTTGSSGGRAYRSTNGSTWQVVASSPTALTAITYGDDRYVSVGTSSVSISTNGGLAWTDVPSAPVGQWSLVGYGNGAFFLAETNVSTDGIFVSPDGISWDVSTLPEEESFISFGSDEDATLLLPTTGANYLINNDGTRWLSKTLPASGQWLGAASLLNIWLIVQSNSASAYLVGTDANAIPLPRTMKVNFEVSVVGQATPLMSQLELAWNGKRWAPIGYSGVRAEVTPPGAPEGLSANLGEEGEAVLNWAAPVSNGGSPISGYTIFIANDSSGPWTSLATGVQETTYTVDGLVPDATYWFIVAAENWAGRGADSTLAEGPQ